MYTIEFLTKPNEPYEIYATHDSIFTILWILNEHSDVIRFKVWRSGCIITHRDLNIAKLSKMTTGDLFSNEI